MRHETLDTVIQKMVGEVLAEMGGKFVPASLEQQELIAAEDPRKLPRSTG